jgi:hypothetical protein
MHHCGLGGRRVLHLANVLSIIVLVLENSCTSTCTRVLAIGRLTHAGSLDLLHAKATNPSNLLLLECEPQSKLSIVSCFKAYTSSLASLSSYY